MTCQPYSIQQLSLHADCPSKGICQQHSRNDKDFHCLKIHRHHWSRARWHIVFLWRESSQTLCDHQKRQETKLISIMKYSTSNSRNKTSRQIKLIKTSGPWSVHVRWGSWIMININSRSCWNIIITERLTSHELKCFLFTEKLRNDANHLRMIHTSRQSTSVSSAFMENETLDTIGLRIIVSSKHHMFQHMVQYFVDDVEDVDPKNQVELNGKNINYMKTTLKHGMAWHGVNKLLQITL